MGGSTDTKSSGTQQSSTQPWAPTQPYLNQALPQIGTALSNTGSSSGENSALQGLIQNEGGAPNFGGQAYDMAGNLISGSNTVNPMAL